MRHCNGCTMCCTEFTVISPAGEVCPHDCTIGCRIYDERPEVCANFQCAWLQGRIDEQYKPDLVGWFLKVHKGSHVDVGFAYGPETADQGNAVKPGFLIASQDGTVHAANKEDRAAYDEPRRTIETMRALMRRRRTFLRGETKDGNDHQYHGWQSS